MRSLAPISRRKIAAGILMFILLTVGGYAAVRWSAGAESESVVSALSGATAGFLVIAAALALLEFALGGSRIWILARKLKPGFRWWDGVHVFLLNESGTGFSIGDHAFLLNESGTESWNVSHAFPFV